MANTTQSNGTPGFTPPGGNSSGTDLLTRRGGSAGGRGRASVTLRDQAGAAGSSMADLMDPANKSLADALRIAFRLLQLSIVLMVGLYLASGYQQVEEGQRGVRILLGRIDQENIPPGPNWSAPAPLGDMLRINTGVQGFELKESFFPRLTPEEEKVLSDPKMREQGLSGGAQSLDPDFDGQLLTADGSIVHTRWRITYKRTEDGRSLRNLADEAGAPRAMEQPREWDRLTPEQRLVAAAVQRGIVMVASRMSIDQVLAGSAREPAREEANRLLERLDAGIRVDTVEMTDKMPPRPVIKNFNDVQAAQAEAARTIEEARGDARQRLAATAGEAATVLLSLIDRYETLLAKGETSQADATLSLIHDAMMRRPVEIDGQRMEQTVSGAVAQRVSEAEQFRTSVVTRAEADARVFEAKLQAYRANPSVFLSNEWTDAVRTFMRRDNVQTVALPSDLSRTVLLINRDPELQRLLEQERLERDIQRRREQRDREAQRGQFEGPVRNAE
jgi:regulator of protease activity HflC (stomatin/prohibitin superfamily)